MDELTGTATERMSQLQATSADGKVAAWLERQLVSALQGWQATVDEFVKLRESHEDF
jgi:hypothetical protein